MCSEKVSEEVKTTGEGATLPQNGRPHCPYQHLHTCSPHSDCPPMVADSCLPTCLPVRVPHLHAHTKTSIGRVGGSESEHHDNYIDDNDNNDVLVLSLKDISIYSN